MQQDERESQLSINLQVEVFVALHAVHLSSKSTRT